MSLYDDKRGSLPIPRAWTDQALLCPHAGLIEPAPILDARCLLTAPSTIYRSASLALGRRWITSRWNTLNRSPSTSRTSNKCVNCWSRSATQIASYCGVGRNFDPQRTWRIWHPGSIWTWPGSSSPIFSKAGCKPAWTKNLKLRRAFMIAKIQPRLALSLSRGSKRPVAQPPALAASCLMTLYMANSFHLARTPKLRLAHLKRPAPSGGLVYS